MGYDPTLHHRRSIRLKGYDYLRFVHTRAMLFARGVEGGYFVTIVTHSRERIFGEIVDSEMRLNDLGRVVREEWFKTKELCTNVELFEDELTVMPNHIHGIIWLFADRRGTARRAPAVEQFGKPIPNSIPTIVRAFKSAVTKRINLLRNSPSNPVWQRNYCEHINDYDREYDNIAEYIDANPRNWGDDVENQTLTSRKPTVAEPADGIHSRGRDQRKYCPRSGVGRI